MTENTKQTIPAAWGSVLTQMCEDYAAQEAAAQVEEMRQMSAFVNARAATCYRLKIEHARSKIAQSGAKRVSSLRWRYQFDAADQVLEATQVYLAILSVLEKPEVQDDLTQEEFHRLVDQLTQECLFVIETPVIWPS